MEFKMMIPDGYEIEYVKLKKATPRKKKQLS